MSRRASAKAKPPPTYEGEVFAVLVYEFPSSDQAVSDRRIKGRLSRKNLGRFEPARVARLRQLKDELQAEIGKSQHSRYYRSSPGPYAEMSDFDLESMSRDSIARYPEIPAAEIESFVAFSVFINHLL